jgi:hypothetical protein
MNWPNYPRFRLPQFEQEAKERYYASYDRNYSQYDLNYILPTAISGESSEDFFDGFKEWAKDKGVYSLVEGQKKFPDLEEWRKMSVKDLKKILERLNLSKSGRKNELYRRIMENFYIGGNEGGQGIPQNIQLPLSQLRSLIPVVRMNEKDMGLSDVAIENMMMRCYLQKEDIEACIGMAGGGTHRDWKHWDKAEKVQDWKLGFLTNGNLDLNNLYIEQFANKIIKLKTWDGTSRLKLDDYDNVNYYFTRLERGFQTQEIWEETCRKLLLACNQRLSLKKCEELLGELPSSDDWGKHLDDDLRAMDMSDYSSYHYYLHGGFKGSDGIGIRAWVRMMCLFSNPSIPESFLRKHWKTVNQTLSELFWHGEQNKEHLLSKVESVFPSRFSDYLPKTPFTDSIIKNHISLNPFITLARNPNLSSDFLEEILQSEDHLASLPQTGDETETSKNYFLAHVMDSNHFLSKEFLHNHIYSNSDIYYEGFLDMDFLKPLLSQYHITSNIFTNLDFTDDNFKLKIYKWSKTISPTGGWDTTDYKMENDEDLAVYAAMNPNPENLSFLLFGRKTQEVFKGGGAPRYAVAKNPSLAALNIWDKKTDPVNADTNDWFAEFDDDDTAQNGGLPMTVILNHFDPLANQGTYLFANPAIFPPNVRAWKSGLFNWRF